MELLNGKPEDIVLFSTIINQIIMGLLILNFFSGKCDSYCGTDLPLVHERTEEAP